MNAIDEFKTTVEKLKTVEFYGFEEYSVDKILTIPTEEVLKGNYSLSTLQFFRSFLSIILKEGFHYSFDKIKNAKVVLFFSHSHASREDYVRFMETVASSSKDVVLFTGQLKNGLRIGYSSIKMTIHLFLWVLAFCRAGIERKYWKKYLISLLEAYKWKCYLVKNQEVVLSIKGMVSIFDAREFENVFTQFLVLHGIPTATLQHGHYSSEYYNDSKHFYIGIGYRGFVSNYFLLWGDSSYKKALACGILEEKLIKVGCPYLINKETIPCKKGVLGLLFDGKGGEQDNANMYMIAQAFAKQHNFKLLVKLHPNDSADIYQFFKDSREELFEGDLKDFASNIEMAICCNTSCLITLLIWDKPIIHYTPIYNVNFYDELHDCSFSDLEGLNELFGKEISPMALLSHYTLTDDVKGNYNNVFQELIKSGKNVHH